MLKRKSTTSTIVAVLRLMYCLIASTQVLAAPFVCGVDLNGNGDVTEPGETVGCITGDMSDQLCPINAVDCEETINLTCPVPGNPCESGVCQTPAACEVVNIFGVDEYVCPTITGPTANFGSDDVACNAACSTATQVCEGPPPSYNCPLDSSIACTLNSGTYQCNLNSCIDLATSPSTTDTFEGQGTMLVDDGERDEDGNCIGTPIIFGGRAMECLPDGLSTAYQNCCESTGTIYIDSVGNPIQTALTNQAIIATFKAAKAAYTAAAASATAAEVGAAATDALAGAFDPTSVAVVIAVTLIMDYLAKACPQESLETAMLNSSGYCIELGSYCKGRNAFGCYQRARTHCCFNSKLAKIIHEQGRPQLKEFSDTFGTIDEPNCRGFTPEEFQSLDFSRIDLSEYYADIAHASQSEIENTIQTTVDSL